MVGWVRLHPSFNNRTMNIKRVYCEIRDSETKEVLGSNQYDKQRGVSDIGALFTKCNTWYDSFRRGLSSGRSLTLTIKVLDAEDASGLLDFE